MASKSKPTSNSIIKSYMGYVLEHNSQPPSVYLFAKENKIKEIEFYEYFVSFDSLEQSIFKAFFDNAFDVLEKSTEYKTYDTRNKLLSFYYTFFEILTLNRSYVIYALKHKHNDFKKLKTLVKLKKRFVLYIQHLDISLVSLNQASLEEIQNKSLQESAWLQLLFTMKFWLEDTSKSFEKTDIFIEKAVNASFDLIDIKPLKGILDFGKFLFKEKMQMS
ncbi:TetR family transcriptional regulator C-terminal domain-containing protein [Flavobacteriaceae bacterium]|jgi:hypothetical protein|nr:TetR family transcriptional regulator C-terminal domain-containing protein [Flavobacteriaceae bacterium]MDB4404562.1 TetR family transcriptional regulator C-terminal domain-containing protein [bacterium]